MTSNFMGLFNPEIDRQQTMLAHEANYFPHWQIGERHLLVYHNVVLLPKREVLNRCNEEMTRIYDLPKDRRFQDDPFVIHWAYGAIPTKIEWDRIEPQHLISVDYRISPMIKDGGGRVCLLSLHTRDYYER